MDHIIYSSNEQDICLNCNFRQSSMNHFVRCIVQYMMDRVNENMRRNHNFLVERFLSILMDSLIDPIDRKLKIVRLYQELNHNLNEWFRILELTVVQD